MKTILATTYAVNPYKGSEDAMGWNYVCQVARFHKVIAITRINNREHIKRFMRAHPDALYDNIQFLYFDLPKTLRWWKRGTWGSMLYFLLWQKAVVRFVRKQGLDFDITHHLNFHNDWSPSYLWKLGKPFVWGPIGHHPAIPKAYRGTMPLADKVKGYLTGFAKYYFWNWSSALEQTKKQADYIWCMNDSVPEVLDLTGKQYHISPSVATQDYGWLPVKEEAEFRVISAGRLVHMKGFDLTLRAFAAFVGNNPEANASLTIAGDGPEKKRLLELADSLGITSRFRLIDWVPRSELMQLMKQASVFLFPSHEGAGMVVPEALSFGLPVITLDNCGPGQFVAPDYGIAVSANTYQDTISQLAAGLTNTWKEKTNYQHMRASARKAFEEKFDWDRRGETLRTIYASL
ncbi:MAG: glycosyltransferase family 4 protein [Lewinella sp.]